MRARLLFFVKKDLLQYSVTVYLIESCQFKASDKSINVWLVQGLILHGEKLPFLAKKDA